MPFPRGVPLSLLILSSVLGGSGSVRAVRAAEFSFFHENVLGTSLELRIAADSMERAQWAEARVLDEIDRLASIFSGYDQTSEFRRWQDGPPSSRAVSSELFEMLAACDRWRDRSGGAFDPRVEVYSQLWSDSERRNRLPTPAERDLARARMARPAWRLDFDSRTASRLSDCPLSLNAIAKGEIIERAAALALRPERGVRGIMINLGGDLRIQGAITRTLGIASPWADSESTPPFTVVRVSNCAVATSGSSQRGFQIAGKWFSHILDPRTGSPVENIAGATVIAPSSADADALATICNVLEPEASLRLARSVPGAECLIVSKNGKLTRSAGWSRFEASPRTELALADHAAPAPEGDGNGDASAGAAAAASSSWNGDFELVVNFEINLPDGEGRRYRRPYVAVWVEDPRGFPVRNLVLWVSMGGAGPFQWLPDLKRWYRADQERKQIEKKDLFFSMARPTRQPGKYKVIWDGKDNNGKPVPPGEYTILIDATREHGTYQNIRKKVDLSDKPFREELKGGIEIKGASIEYRRKAAAQPTE